MILCVCLCVRVCVLICVNVQRTCISQNRLYQVSKMF